MRTPILTNEQRKAHKKNWNKNYSGTIGYALSQMRYWKKKADKLIFEHDEVIMEQARQYINEFAISEENKVEFFQTVANFITQLASTSTARDLIQIASDKSELNEKLFESFIAGGQAE